MAIAVLLACLLTFVTAKVCLPVTAMLFLAIAVPVCAGFLRYRLFAEALSFWGLRLGSHAASVSQGKGQSAWDLISMSAEQIFGPSRMALLELEPGKTHSTLIRTDGCDDSDILERRRDISREPWQKFIESGLPGKHTGRPVFKSTDNENSEAGDRAGSRGDTEFIVPLLSQGTIFGFMVLELQAASLRNWKDLENVLLEFSFESSRIVARQRSSDSSSTQEASWKHRILHVPESIEFARIEKQQRTIGDSWSQIEQSFESDSGCRILFDSYGRVLKSNSRMIRSIESEKAISECTFIELLPQIADVDLFEARKLFRTALLHGRSSEVRTNPSRIDGRVVLSRVNWGDAESEMFNRGVLLEVFDQTTTEDSRKLDEVLSRLEKLQFGLGEQASFTSDKIDSVADIVADLSDWLSKTEPQRPESNGMTFDSVWCAAEFNAQPALQKSNLKTDFRVTGGDKVSVSEPRVVGYAIEVCLSVMSEICSNGVLLIESVREGTDLTVKFRNGMAEMALAQEFASPGILGARQTDLLFDVRLMMQTCAGALDVEDNSNGEAVFHLTFPVEEIEEEAHV